MGGGDDFKQCERGQCHRIIHVQMVNTVNFFLVYIPSQYKMYDNKGQYVVQAEGWRV